MYGCESWKKAERRRIDAFELWFWRRLLRVPWTARRSNRSILKEINPEYSLEGLTLKLKLQYFGHLMWRAYSLEKTLSWERLKAGGEEGDRGWDGWRASSTQWKRIWVNLGDGEGQGSLVCCSPWGRKELDTTEWLNNNNNVFKREESEPKQQNSPSTREQQHWGFPLGALLGKPQETFLKAGKYTVN